MDYQGATALITGASSGLGSEFAVQLAARGADLVLVARRADRLEELAARLRADHGVTVTTMPIDLAAPDAAAAVRRALTERELAITMLVNNAGAGVTRPLLETPADQVRSQLAINIDALVMLTKEFLPDLRARDNGVLLNVASVTAYLPMPNMAVYAAAKAFVLHFTEALAYEMRDSPLKVLALSPAPTRTEFYATSGTGTTGTRFQTAAEVVTAGLRALDARSVPASVVTGRANRLQVSAARLLSRRMVLRIAGRSIQPAH